MTKALLNAILFEMAALAASGILLVLGCPAIALIAFVSFHLPSSIFFIPFLVAGVYTYDMKIPGGGLWSSLLLVFGTAVVVGIQFPLLITAFRWHLGKSEAFSDHRLRESMRSLGIFVAGSVIAFILAVLCISLTPLCTSGNCVPLQQWESPPENQWSTNCGPGGLQPFGTLRKQRFATVLKDFWGFLPTHSPWRFAMLGLYMAAVFIPVRWIIQKWRKQI